MPMPRLARAPLSPLPQCFQNPFLARPRKRGSAAVSCASETLRLWPTCFRDFSRVMQYTGETSCSRQLSRAPKTSVPCVSWLPTSAGDRNTEARRISCFAKHLLMSGEIRDLCGLGIGSGNRHARQQLGVRPRRLTPPRCMVSSLV